MSYIEHNVEEDAEENSDGEETIRIISAAKPIRVSAESIWSKPLTKRQKAVLDRVATK